MKTNACSTMELFNHMQAVFIAINQGNCPVEILHVITGVGPMEIFLKRVLGNFIDEPFLYYDQKKFVLQHSISMNFQTCRI